ncbi:unnamed protein product [Gadus morhua 'NCC']
MQGMEMSGNLRSVTSGTPGLDPSGCYEANSGSLLSTVQRSPSSVTLATAWRPSTKSPLGVMKREDERLGSVPVSESERAMLQDSIDQLELTFN